MPWKLIGVAGLAGVAATGVVIARKRRTQRDYDHDELRERLHRRLAEIAERRGRTNAQVMLRWAVQRDIPVIPKSVRRERIIENAQIFDFTLTDEEMAALDGLS